jgi:hypothetical protein
VPVLTYAMRFTGRVSSVRPGVFECASRAPAEAIVTAAFDAPAFVRSTREGASLLAEITLDGEGRFEENGTVAFGDGDAIHFRSAVPGTLSPLAGHAGHGAGVCVIEGGAGRLASVWGHVTSAFVLADGGELVDARVAVVVVPARREP